MTEPHESTPTPQVPYRELDPEVAAAELRLGLPSTESALKLLDKTKVVTQKTMQLDFTI